ncbi:MAG: tetratricopeptide repeat protein, partial [Clostridiaceae bacterium]
DSPRENARLNLRNAIYVIGKATSKELFNKEINKTKIAFSDNIEVITDLKYFENPYVVTHSEINQKDDISFSLKRLLSFYEMDFLASFDKSDKGTMESIDLNELIQTNREKYRNEYKVLLKKLYSSLLTDKIENPEMRGEGSLDDKMAVLSKILEIDPLSESSALELIKIYTEKRKFSEATDIYKKYQKNLKNKLDMEPGLHFKETFKKLLDQKPFELQTDVIYPLFSRDGITQVINKTISMFTEGIITPSLLVKGIPGTGKTRLIHEIEEIKVSDKANENTIMVKIYCFRHEKELERFSIFLILKKLLRQLDINKGDSIIQTIYNKYPGLKSPTLLDYLKSKTLQEVKDINNFIFSLISKRFKLILAIDEIDSMDSESMETLDYCFSTNSDNMVFIMTTSLTANSVSVNVPSISTAQKTKLSSLPIIRSLLGKNLLNIQTMLPFSKNETMEFIHEHAPSAPDPVTLYEMTSGLPVLLTDLVSQWNKKGNIDLSSSKIEVFIKKTCSLLKPISGTILENLSLLEIPCYVEQLITMMDVERQIIIDSLVELNEFDLLDYDEDVLGEPIIQISNPLIKKYIEESLNQISISEIHKKWAKIFSSTWDKYADPLRQLNEAIRQFELSRSIRDAFIYKIIRMEYLYDVNHQLFPVLPERDTIRLPQIKISPRDFNEEFDSMATAYKALPDHRSPDMLQYYIRLLYIHARFFTDRGLHGTAEQNIKRMINLSMQNKFYGLAFKGYLLLIHNAINIEDKDLIEDALRETSSNLEGNISEENEILLKKFRGYLYLLKGHKSEGEASLYEVLSYYETRELFNEYTLCKASVLFYLGEGARLRGDFNSALEFYEQALVNCNEESDLPSLAILLSRMGETNYKIRQPREAEFYLKRSLSCYESIIFTWGKEDAKHYLRASQRMLEEENKKN